MRTADSFYYICMGSIRKYLFIHLAWMCCDIQESCVTEIVPVSSSDEVSGEREGMGMGERYHRWGRERREKRVSKSILERDLESIGGCKSVVVP